MSTITYTVGGNDVSQYAQGGRMSIVRKAGKSPSVSAVVLYNPAVVPSPGNNVTITYGSTTLFGGVVTEIVESYLGKNSYKFQLICSDYTKLFDKLLVVARYDVDKTIAQVVEDIVDSWTDPAVGFTHSITDASINLLQPIVYNYRIPSDCLRELAELMEGLTWYIDENKVVHFFRRTSSVAPYEVNDTTIQTMIENFQIGCDYSQIKNRIYIRGGYWKSTSAITVSMVADGEQRYWILPYRPYDLTMTVNTVAVVLGEENIDADDGTKDYFYNEYEKIVKCASATTTPSAGDVMAFTFKYKAPALVRVDDDVSQSNIATAEGYSGIYEYIYKDSSLSEPWICQRIGTYLLQKYSDPIITGSFSTMTAGFDVGQALTINRTGRNYNDTYTISQVEIESLGNNVLKYYVDFEGIYDAS